MSAIDKLTLRLKRREKEKKLWHIAAFTSALWLLSDWAQLGSWVSIGIGLAVFAVILWFFYSYLPDYRGNRWRLVGGLIVGVIVVSYGGLWIVGHILVWLHVIP